MQGKTGGDIHGADALAGARTPEELETLFEDICVTRDPTALAGLFEEQAVLMADDGHTVRGGDAITCLMMELWEGNQIYVANPLRVVQARDIALIVGERSINVARRGGDGDWRYVIALPFVRERSDAADTKEVQ